MDPAPAGSRRRAPVAGGDLVELGLVERTGPDETAGRRTRLTITRAGRRTRAAWLATPVQHLRDLRTEFLLKVALCGRTGIDIAPLVTAQRALLGPTIAGLLADAPSGGASDDPPPGGPPRDDRARAVDPVDVWRQESARAAQRFLDRLASF